MTVFKCLDFDAYYAGENFQLFHSPFSGATQALPTVTSELLKACTRFRTLEEHASDVSKLTAFADVPREIIVNLLSGLAATGFLTSYEDTLQRCQLPSAPEARVTMSTIGIITVDRPAALRRVVTTCAENARLHGRRVAFTIMDDSRTPESREENISILKTLKADYGLAISYAGKDEKTQFSRRLAKRAAMSPPRINVAISKPPGWPGQPGSNRNALMLQCVGEAFLSLDDDMVCKLGKIPGVDDRLSLTSETNPTEIWFFPDQESALATTETVEDDLLGLHESLLARNVGRLAADWSASPDIDLDGVTADFLKRLGTGGGRVVYTMAGLLGDSGLGSSLPYFTLQGQSLQRLINEERGYRTVLNSRQIARSALRPTISDGLFCFAGNLGLDGTRMLPPFPTAIRNEDGAFLQLVNKCFPDGFIGFIPRTMLHAPVQNRASSTENFEQGIGGPPASMMLPTFLAQWDASPGAVTPEARLRELGSHIAGLGSLPASEFADHLQATWWEDVSSEITVIEDQLKKAEGRQPETWLQDQRRYITASRAAMEREADVTPDEVRRGRSRAAARAKFQESLMEFGNLLSDWPDITSAARDLRVKGEGLAREL